MATRTIDERSASFSHFVRLAQIGSRNPCASSGELRAARIAKALLENVPGLDDSAMQGIAEFAFMAQRMPESARQLLKGNRQ